MALNDRLNEIRWIEAIRRRIHASRSRRAGEKRLLELHKDLKALIGNDDPDASANLAVRLYAQWGDELDATRERFVRSCLQEFQTTKGNVLLSSAGLLTLLLGALSEGDKEKRIWCLEHDTHSTNTIRSWLTRYAITGTYVIRAPIAVIGGMVRYQIMTRHLPKNIGMVVCERTGAAPGSTLSTLLTVGPHLADEFTLFARRVDIHGEAPLIKRWAAKHNASFVVVDSKEGFIKLARREGMQLGGRAIFETTESANGEAVA